MGSWVLMIQSLVRIGRGSRNDEEKLETFYIRCALYHTNHNCASHGNTKPTIALMYTGILLVIGLLHPSIGVPVDSDLGAGGVVPEL